MKVIETSLEGLLVIEPDVFNDNRGFFFESFKLNRYKASGVPDDFVQDNISRSVKNTLRGLHYQVGTMAQGKLCQVPYGAVYDVVVDIRFGSPTFGKFNAVELSDKNKLQLWIPPGFAHGFAVLSDEAVFHYKCTNYYDKSSERTLLYNDPALNIDWKITEPVVSEKDKSGILLKDIEKDFEYGKIKKD